MDSSPPGSSVHGILQARVLKWVAISFTRESSQPRDQTQVSSIDRQMLYRLSHQGPAQWRKDFLFRDRILHFYLLPMFMLTPRPAPLRPALSEGPLSLKMRIQAVWFQQW